MKFSKRELIFISLIGGLFLLVSLSFIGNFDNNNKEEDLDWNFKEQEVEPVIVEQDHTILVDVKGQVAAPGVYELEAGQRVIDLIERAGGFTSEANELKINLAQVLDDAMVVYIPKVGEDDSPILETVNSGNASTNAEGKIRINQATVEELQQLPGVGPAKAKAIYSYREENGPFKTVDDLQKVSGIGSKSLDKLKDYIEIR